MFKNTFQSGFLSILYSIGSKPLQIWDKKVRYPSRSYSQSTFSLSLSLQVRNGHIKRFTDNEIQSLVLEIVGTNVSTTYITCPADPKKTLGIKLPFLVMIIKNLKKYFTFEVQVSDNNTLVNLLQFHSSRFSMIEMFVVDFVLVIINQQHVLNHLSVQCQCVWMTDGIKFNLIYLILHDVLTERITLKP